MFLICLLFWKALSIPVTVSPLIVEGIAIVSYSASLPKKDLIVQVPSLFE